MTGRTMGKPTGYCFYVLARRMGPWRATAREAKEDAIDAGFAQHDEFSQTIFLDACANIWTSYSPVTIEARPVADRRPADQPDQAAPAAYPARIGRIIARREGNEAA